ncbi:hypothetical protein DPMN_156319 [Dreissena polymorpha]|uniref:Uncharacterized protein n=1 Tax=Dreissena polymorpha TaxID=45954 RepID=A0A9D4J7G8_DREPO|nr:hypothetical protein DPMN_156319 [Dreissena polymorpha]
MPRIVGANKDIVNVWAYKVPLTDMQLTKFILYHMFIVFETQDHMWWSIEKHTDGISLQRSRVCSAVRDSYKHNPRKPPIETIDTDKGSKSIHDHFQWLGLSLRSKKCSLNRFHIFTTVSK